MFASIFPSSNDGSNLPLTYKIDEGVIEDIDKKIIRKQPPGLFIKKLFSIDY
jgi:hypothetical protein